MTDARIETPHSSAKPVTAPGLRVSIALLVVTGLALFAASILDLVLLSFVDDRDSLLPIPGTIARQVVLGVGDVVSIGLWWTALGVTVSFARRGLPSYGWVVLLGIACGLAQGAAWIIAVGVLYQR